MSTRSLTASEKPAADLRGDGDLRMGVAHRLPGGDGPRAIESGRSRIESTRSPARRPGPASPAAAAAVAPSSAVAAAPACALPRGVRPGAAACSRAHGAARGAHATLATRQDTRRPDDFSAWGTTGRRPCQSVQVTRSQLSQCAPPPKARPKSRQSSQRASDSPLSEGAASRKPRACARARAGAPSRSNARRRRKLQGSRFRGRTRCSRPGTSGGALPRDNHGAADADQPTPKSGQSRAPSCSSRATLGLRGCGYRDAVVPEKRK